MTAPGIYLERPLLDSRAWRALKRRDSIQVYLHFLRKRKLVKEGTKKGKAKYVTTNNGEIVFPYREAEKELGIKPREFSNAVDELIAKGFLDINHQGSGGRKNDVTTYVIDDRWVQYGTENFRPPKKGRQPDKRQGRGWAAYNARRKSSITNMSAKKADSMSGNVSPTKRLD